MKPLPPPRTFAASSSSSRRPMPQDHPEWHSTANPITAMLKSGPPRNGVCAAAGCVKASGTKTLSIR